MPWGWFQKRFASFQYILPKLVYCRNRASCENFKLKGHALGTCTKFQLEIIIINVISLYIFARLFWRARKTFVKQPRAPCVARSSAAIILTACDRRFLSSTMVYFSTCANLVLIMKNKNMFFSNKFSWISVDYRGHFARWRTSHSLTKITVMRAHYLTHWGRYIMAAILLTTFWGAFCWMRMYEFRLKFHWSLFLRVQLTIFQNWFG